MRETMIILLWVVFLILGCPAWLADWSVPVWTRALTYHFFHANIFHFILNSMAIWNLFSPRNRRNKENFLIAFIISTLVYPLALRPVVGVSNLLYATIGLATPAFSSKWWTSSPVVTFYVATIVMLFIPQLSGITHIAAFVLGVGVAGYRRVLARIDHDIKRAGGC